MGARKFLLSGVFLVSGLPQAFAQYPYTPPVSPPPGGPARVTVLNGCPTGDTSRGIASDLLLGGFNIVKIGAAPRRDYPTTVIIFQAAYYNDAVNLSRRISGTKRLARASAPSPAADIFVITGCDARPSAQAGPAGIRPAPSPPAQLIRRGQPPPVFPSVNGGSGLVSMPSADVLSFGAWEASLFVNSSFHLLPDEYTRSNITGLPKQDIDLQASFNWGVWKDLETGVMLPASLASGIKTGAGVRNIRLNLRYGVLQNPQEPYKLALSGFFGAPVAGQNLGSGKPSAGAQLNFSYLFGERKRHSWNMNFGYELSDYISKSDPLQGYEGLSKLIASLGYGYRAVEQFMVSLELLGTSVLGRGGPEDIIGVGDEDFFALLGLRVLPSRDTVISLGGGVGLPPDVLRPDTNYLVIGGFSYLFQKAKLAPVPLPSSPPGPPPAVKRGPREMRIVVLNGCATYDPSQSISSSIISSGYNVTKVGRAPQQTYTSSMIIFQPEYYAEAVAISRMVPGAQRLAKASRPTPAVDVYVISGCSAVPPTMAPAPVPAPPMAPVAPGMPAPGFAPPAAPAPVAPPMKKKALSELKIELLDGCGKPGVVEKVGKPLIVGGMNINKIGKASQMNLSQTDVQYRGGYLSEAQEIAKNLKGTPKFSPKTGPGEEEVTIIIGCDQQ